MQNGGFQTRRAAELTSAGPSGLSRRLTVWIVLLVLLGNIGRARAGNFPFLDPPAHGSASSWRLEVRPLEAANPVRKQQLIIATVYDEKGVPRRNRRIEWTLEGVGSLIEVDDSGVLFRGHKIDTHSAVTYTAFKEHLFTRGNVDPTDDFMIRPGQSWIIVSSAVEGDTQISAHAPDIESWENQHVVVSMHWIDASWRLPPPTVQRAGTPLVCTTQVVRPANQQGIAGYRVRYRIIDGPPALFLPNKSQEEIGVSDSAGNASVTLVQTQPTAGVNRVAIEVIRPPDPNAPAGTRVGEGETHVNWQGPQITLSNVAPPTVPLGQEVPLTLNVSNKGQVECQEITLREPMPDGLQFVRSDPPAIVEGNQLIWTLPALASGRGHTVQAVFRSTRPGPVSVTASLRTYEGLTEQARATTQITIPQLAIKIVAGDTGIVGVPVNYDITISNPGSADATNVQIVTDFDPGLEHETKANPLRQTVGLLGPGESKVITLALTPRQTGSLTNHVNATADSNLKATTQHTVVAKRAELSVDLQGTQKTYQNQTAEWTITALNKGETPLSNVQVHDVLPPELVYSSADPPATPMGTDVVWSLGSLAPGERRLLHLKTQCVRLTPKTVNTATAMADLGIKGQAQAAIEIDGLPAFHLEVHDLVDPVEVGAKTTYRIDVQNQGTLAGTKVEIIADVPAQFKILSAQGPGQATFEGNRVRFGVVDTLPPGQSLSCTVDVQGLQPGDVRFRVEMRSATLSKEIVEEESTTIYGQGPSATPPPTAPPH